MFYTHSQTLFSCQSKCPQLTLQSNFLSFSLGSHKCHYFYGWKSSGTCKQFKKKEKKRSQIIWRTRAKLVELKVLIPLQWEFLKHINCFLNLLKVTDFVSAHTMELQLLLVAARCNQHYRNCSGRRCSN